MTTRDLARAVEQVEIAAWTDLLRAATPAQAARCGIAIHEIAGGISSIVASCDVLAFNRIVGLGTGGPVTDAELSEAIERYADSGVGRMFVQVNPIVAASTLTERLRSRGLRHHNNWVKLCRDTSPLPAVNTDLETRVIGPESAADFARVLTEAFDWPDHLRPWIAGSIGRDGWRHYMAFDHRRPAATAALFVSGAWAWIDLAATDENYRGRGAQGRLLEMRILDAARAGCRFVSVETAEQTPDKEAPSYRNMIRYGFQEAFVRPNYLWTREET